MKKFKNFDDVYNALFEDNTARMYLNAVKRDGEEVEDIAFRLMKKAVKKASLKDLRAYVVTRMQDEVNDEMIALGIGEE